MQKSFSSIPKLEIRKLRIESLENREMLSANVELFSDLQVVDFLPDFRDYAELDGSIYFNANDGVHLSELWKSDGTPEGTVLVKDIDPLYDSSPREFAAFNGEVFFAASKFGLGSELWKTDGTEDGTVLVKDINAKEGAYNGSNPADLIAVGESLFFVADDDIHGRELWVTDGTETGTRMVKDIRTVDRNSPSYMTEHNGFLYFVIENDEGDEELWRSDGTETGTIRITDGSVDGMPTDPIELTTVGNDVFFSSNNKIWKTNESGDGVEIVKSFGDDTYANTKPKELIEFQGDLYFQAFDAVHRKELWKSDGTEEGTHLFLDIDGDNKSSSPGGFFEHNNELFFSAATMQQERELWKTDGTVAGTKMVKDIDPGLGSSKIFDYVSVNGLLYFTAFDGEVGRQLWRTDGTETGTERVTNQNLSGKASPETLMEVNGSLLFAMNVGDAGRNLWIAHPTVTGTSGNDVVSVDILQSEIRIRVNGIKHSVNRVGTTKVWVEGLGGKDILHLNGTDGDDKAILNPGSAVLSGLHFQVTGNDFGTINVKSGSGGNDFARVFGSALDDAFVARPESAIMRNSWSINRIFGFDSVIARAAKGVNRARFIDSAGNDEFVGKSTFSKMSGEGYSNKAVGFGSVAAISNNGGQDTAYLFDSDNSDDKFYGRAKQGRLFGELFSNLARGFDVLEVRASGGFDTWNSRNEKFEPIRIGLWDRII